MGRYFSIFYQGVKLMDLFAKTSIEAKEKAIRTYQTEGRRGMNLARLEVL